MNRIPTLLVCANMLAAMTHAVAAVFSFGYKGTVDVAFTHVSLVVMSLVMDALIRDFTGEQPT